MVNPISFGPSGINSQADFAPLASLGQIYQKAQQDQANKAAFDAFRQTGDPKALLASGDMSLSKLGIDIANRQQEAATAAANRQQDQAHQKFMEGIATRTADRADEDKFVVKEVTDPNTGVTSFVRIKTTGGEGPISTGAPAPSQPNNPFSSGGKFNNEQGKAAGFADRMLQSEGTLSGVAPIPGQEGPVTPGVQNEGMSVTQTGLSKIPGVGNYLISKERQKFEQAKRDFVNAQLRRESGAAIAQSEFDSANKQYFPVPGDSQQVLAQKALNRRAAIEAMGREGGAAYKPKLSYDAQGVLAPYGQQPATNAAPAAAVAAPQSPSPPKIGELRDGYRYKGGNPGDPANWAKAQN